MARRSARRLLRLVGRPLHAPARRRLVSRARRHGRGRRVASIAGRVRRRGARVRDKDDGAPVADEREDPDELGTRRRRRRARRRLDRAVRLRFRAGLLRLGDRGAIRYRPSVTTGEVRRTLGSRAVRRARGHVRGRDVRRARRRAARRRRRAPGMAARARRVRTPVKPATDPESTDTARPSRLEPPRSGS